MNISDRNNDIDDRYTDRNINIDDRYMNISDRDVWKHRCDFTNMNFVHYGAPYSATSPWRALGHLAQAARPKYAYYSLESRPLPFPQRWMYCIISTRSGFETNTRICILCIQPCSLETRPLPPQRLVLLS